MGIRDLIRLADVGVLPEDGDRVDIAGWNLRTVWTLGHSPGHLCFVDPDRRILLSGDHVLPRISPAAVTVHPQQRPSPLADFMDTLVRVAALDATRCCPHTSIDSGDLPSGSADCCTITRPAWPRSSRRLTSFRG